MGKKKRANAPNLSATEFEDFKHKRKCRQLFSKYDKGIRISPTMMYSVTREGIANKIAEYVASKGFTYVVDGCGGAGGNSIAFARAGLEVANVEIDENNLNDAMHNAEIYGVENSIYFAQEDILEFEPYYDEFHTPDQTCFFISPEWDGPKYREEDVFDPEQLNPPLSAILQYARTQKFAMTIIYAPRSIDLPVVEKLGCKECHYMFQYGHCNGLCLLF